MSNETVADWCFISDELSVCGTRMKELSRKSDGTHWCFVCRKHSEFEFIVKVPDGFSYYGPSCMVECANCKTVDADLFPGRAREWEEL